MPQQLIYTSAPRGVVAGRSGYCTVARTASMREALMLQLERFCYYQHLSLSGGKERPIFSCRIVDIRGTRFHVVSRMQDAGLDFTGRTNFIAHHLVFTPEEIRQFPTAPVILRDWPRWVKSWAKEPELLENENWGDLEALATKTNVPAQTWQQVAGDATNGYGLLEARVGATFRVDDLADDVILALLAESLELLEVRDVRRDFRSVAWNYTFTTSMQEQDNPADFRWRCIHSDNPAANRLATPDCRELTAVRATKLTGEENAFARIGRQPPKFAIEPADIRITEGQPIRFSASAEGVPAPAYLWYRCDKDGKETELLNGETSADLNVADPPIGVTRYRVWAANSVSSAQSRLATLSVERKVRLAQPKANGESQAKAATVSYQKSADDIERQRQRLEADEAERVFQERLGRKKSLATCLTVVLLVGAGLFVWWHKFYRVKPVLTQQPTIRTNSDGNIAIILSAKGSHPITYQLIQNNELILSSTDSILPLININLTDASSLSVIVTNAAGVTMSTVVSWPGKPPVITQQPFFQTNGGLGAISVSAIGASPLAYQWYKDDKAILNATSPICLPPSNGWFVVVITNAVGGTTSQPIQWKSDTNSVSTGTNKLASKRGQARADSDLDNEKVTAHKP